MAYRRARSSSYVENFATDSTPGLDFLCTFRGSDKIRETSEMERGPVEIVWILQIFISKQYEIVYFVLLINVSLLREGKSVKNGHS